MSIDDRVKEVLKHSSRIVDPDVRRDLVTVRRKVHRGMIVRRVGAIVLAAAITVGVVVIGPRIFDAVGDRGTTQPGGLNNGPSASASFPLEGSWTQEQSCGDIVRRLAAHGLSHYAALNIVNDGYREGSRSEIADEAHPCRGSGPPLLRTWTFDGLELRGYVNGKQVDFAPFAVLDDHTIRVSHINMAFQIDGDVLMFAVPPPPASCTGPDCLSQHAWATVAFGLGPWHRVAK
jgi:hypothetical protein